eukprot:1147306-Pelagomonas_calceolata.AAC.1
METSRKRHWRMKEKDQRTRKRALDGESRPGALHIILGITKVTGRRNIVIPSSLLIFECVDARAKSGHIASDVFGQN